MKTLLTAFRYTWHSEHGQKEHIETFSLEKWKNLPEASKKGHSISNCTACAQQHADLQSAISLNPIFVYKDQENDTVTEKMSGNKFAKTHFSQFNSFCIASTGKPFTEIAMNYVGGVKKAIKQTKKETVRQVRDECNEAMSENALLHTHSQNISYSMSDRLRLKKYYNAPISANTQKEGP